MDDTASCFLSSSREAGLLFKSDRYLGLVFIRHWEKTKGYLEAPSQELVLHLQKVAFICLRLERLVDDGKLGVVLDVLPAGIAVTAAPVKDREMLVRDHHFSFCSC